MNSLRARLLLSAGGVLLAFVLLTAYTLETADRQRAEEAVRDRLQGLVYTLLSNLDVDDDGRLTIDESALPDARLSRPDSGLAAVIVSPADGVLWHSFSTLDLNINVPPADVGQWRFHAPQNRDGHFQLVHGISWTVGPSEQLFRLAVQESPAAFNAQRATFRKSLWLGLGLSAVLLLALLLAILHVGLLPLGRLAREVSALEAGDRDSIATSYPGELQPLATALNAMLRHERRRQQRYRNALADLAHSLKTPLAALRSQTSTSKTDHDALEHMQQLIDYQLQKAAAGSSRSFAAPVSLAPLVDRLIAALSKVHAERGVVFSNRLPPDASLRMEQGDLLEIFGNLLDNAARFCRQQVTVTATRPHDRLHIHVDDDGPGFPAGLHEQLLERGVRADSHNPGQGIGLAVVAEIVRANDGQIRLTTAPGGGARVDILLPGR